MCAQLAVYDPKVTADQIFRDLSTAKFEWDRPDYSRSHSRLLENVKVSNTCTHMVHGRHRMHGICLAPFHYWSAMQHTVSFA